MLLTNCYVLYVKYHKMHDRKNICSHYDFIKQIGLAWVNQELHWPKQIKRDKKRAITKDNNMTTRAKRRINTDSCSASSTSSSKCIPVTNANLHPTAGKLNLRLNTSVQHLPEFPKAKKAKCQLHRWARERDGAEVTSSVVTCSVCRVNLCITCYNIFHKEANIEGKKAAIAAS